MGLDYGTKTVGVAVSDPLGITAQAVETIARKEENYHGNGHCNEQGVHQPPAYMFVFSIVES